MRKPDNTRRLVVTCDLHEACVCVTDTCLLHEGCVCVPNGGVTQHVPGTPRVEDALIVSARETIATAAFLDLEGQLRSAARELREAMAAASAVLTEKQGARKLLREMKETAAAARVELEAAEETNRRLATDANVFMGRLGDVRARVTETLEQLDRDIARRGA